MTVALSTPLLVVLYAMIVARCILGLVPFVAAGLSTRVLGFPGEHDTPTTRLMARLFGTRDFALGILVLWALTASLPVLRFVLVFNAAVDGGDFVACLIPVVGRQGIDRGAIISGGCAFFAVATWMTIWVLLAR